MPHIALPLHDYKYEFTTNIAEYTTRVTREEYPHEGEKSDVFSFLVKKIAIKKDSTAGSKRRNTF